MFCIFCWQSEASAPSFNYRFAVTVLCWYNLAAMPRFGIEEEVFITEPEKPTLRSLLYLSRLLAKNPRFYYTHSAHNFTRGKDLKWGLMSGVEISTDIHEDTDALIEDLKARRADLASVSSGLIVPIGHLLDCNTPSNTCALHVHIDGVQDKKRLYGNLLHFLPVLPLFTINSPMVSGTYFGQSYRIHASFAIGPIKSDWSTRFQDLIFSKRLGTIELRVCDACWDLERYRWLLRVVKAISELNIDLDPQIERYNSLREEICRRGFIDELSPIVEELKSLIDFPTDIITYTASDELADTYKKHGLVATYSAVDNAYRNGVFQPREVRWKRRSHLADGIIGFAGYFLPRLPYYALKGLKEM
jgi:gamma-glutamyl:cysteine ligase YbdK (ATP-grasp superfamily)